MDLGHWLFGYLWIWLFEWPSFNTQITKSTIPQITTTLDLAKDKKVTAWLHRNCKHAVWLDEPIKFSGKLLFMNFFIDSSEHKKSRIAKRYPALMHNKIRNIYGNMPVTVIFN
jgi:hypothetical protein